MNTEQTAEQAQNIANELLTNEKLVEHPTYGTVKLSRPTPRKERLIAEQRRKAYHADIQNPDILARAEVERIAISRGLWSKEKRARASELSRRIGEVMGVLDAVKYESVEMVVKELVESKKKLIELCGEEVIDSVTRYFDLEQPSDMQDRKAIMDAASNSDVDEILEKADTAKAQASLLRELVPLRNELSELQEQQASLFSDTLEDRADRVNSLAKIFYCCTQPNDKSLWPSFDAMWDSLPTDIAWLQQELFLFENGISEEYRHILERHNFLGFTQRATTTEPQSEDSPEVQSSNSAGESVEQSPPSSSETTA